MMGNCVCQALELFHTYVNTSRRVASEQIPVSEVIMDVRSEVTGAQGISLRPILALIDPLDKLFGIL